MTELLKDHPEWWTDSSGNTPPANWDGTNYLFNSATSGMGYTGPLPVAGDTITFDQLAWDLNGGNGTFTLIKIQQGDYQQTVESSNPNPFGPYTFTIPYDGSFSITWNNNTFQYGGYLQVRATGAEASSAEASSCIGQFQWQWSNSPDSKRWTTPRQFYRLRGPYYPIEDNATLPFAVVETRDKIRGTGKTLSIKFSTEPGKHCTIYGWALNIGTNGNV